MVIFVCMCMSLLNELFDLGSHWVVLRATPGTVLRSDPWQFLGDNMLYQGLS